MFSTVLIIDKRKELSVKYKKCVDSLNESAIIAQTLKDGIALLQNIEPEMIIVSDSIEEDLASFCQKIRALTFNYRPIIVALSKSADTEDRIKVLENGADDFISEPVNTDEFKTRIMAHLRRDIESNLDSNTLLPNDKLTRKTLKRTLLNDTQAVLLVQIQNIEAYKALYTELAADKIVQTFIAITKSAINDNDFLGTIDDTTFIIITNRYSAEKLSAFLTFAFDTVAPKFYSQEDSKRGYTLLKGDRYAEMRVNFVSILIGGVVEGFSRINNVDILLNKLEDIKNIARKPVGSNYAIERIKLEAHDSVVETLNNKKIYIKENDESLGLLLRTTLELSGYDVQDELVPETATQPSIIIMDSEDNLSGLELLKELKNNQNFYNTKFIVTTTHNDKTLILDSGADLYLPKPYEMNDLIKWVNHLINW